MAKKGPQTKKGKERKAWTGDGRKNTPMEKMEKAGRSGDEAVEKAMKYTDKTVEKTFSGKTKKKRK